jgi:hypothetical protein
MGNRTLGSLIERCPPGRGVRREVPLYSVRETFHSDTLSKSGPKRSQTMLQLMQSIGSEGYLTSVNCVNTFLNAMTLKVGCTHLPSIIYPRCYLLLPTERSINC